jgi:tetratricopeptide (TPR) repeat protein
MTLRRMLYALVCVAVVAATGCFNHALAQTTPDQPADANGFYQRGNSYEKQGDLDRAIADYDEAIRLDPKHANAFYNRGNAYTRKGDFDRAIADFSEAIRLNPKDSIATTNRGSVYERKGDFDRALADYNDAIRLDPKNALAFNNRCWLRATLGKELAKALSDCNLALLLAPNDANTMESRGFVYLRLDRIKESIADYVSALKLEPQNANALYGRGLARLKQGDRTGGETDIAAATAIKSNIAEEFARYGVRP